MSFFDDDFFNTRVTRRSQNRRNRGSGFRPNTLSGSTVRVALISSVSSVLFIVILYLLFMDGKPTQSNAQPAMLSGQTLLEASERMINASDIAGPTVVSVINMTQQALDMEDKQMDWLHSDQVSEYASLGSGVIYKKQDDKAYVITNAHVIQDAVELYLVMNNGERKVANVVGKDTITDLAVLEVEGKDITKVIEIGSSKKLRVGEMVITIGNPLGFSGSVSEGIVSFKDRIIPVSLNQNGFYDWEQIVIQTTAAINQGNSGGAMIDLNGKLVGINSMKIADYGVEGIGFAIPIDDAMPILDSLLANGKVLRPYLGIYSMDLDFYSHSQDTSEWKDDLTDEEIATDDKTSNQALPDLPADVKQGIIVLEAVGPAQEAGLKFNDVIVALDGNPIQSTIELRKYLYSEKKIGESVEITYYRNGKKSTISVKLSEKTEE
ncbi:MAG: trypsin-like peptidase domain-containing protein [Candidatus Cohnella colombiensis]|uniref:Trypsin-like peptidase domain-containing protein n=1 Tax=Candidatus Cohnella colombiensis TaxID=3121368 RepID=A0AA95EWE7_9BACL|nr:MAG: trypsin-like peptidase domain-containing protein [Cohnella sp.]